MPLTPKILAIKPLTLSALIAAALHSPFAISAEENPDAIKLIEQGYFWLDKGKREQAGAAWNKALRIQPDNAEAKAGLDMLEQSAELSQAELNQARKLAASKNYAASIELYQNAFGGNRPPLHLGSEYYETLAATENGWQSAVSGLESLLAIYPNHLRLQLSLAKLHTYRESTRRFGIQQLEKLSRSSRLHEEALAAWKQALLWLNGTTSDAPHYTAYLSQAPLDSEINQQLKRIDRDKEGNLGQAWKSFDAGDRNQAERAFKQILKSEPNNADALAGLGLLRLDQRRFGEASRMLKKATELDARKKPDLETALKTAQYWNQIKLAESARKNGQPKRAKRLIRSAAATFPGRSEHLELQAAVESDLGNTKTAINLYQRILKSKPNNRGAQRALVSQYLEAGQEKKALATVKRYGLSREKFFKDRDQIVARQLRNEASELSTNGDVDLAIQRLIRAKALDPDNTWIRHDLALLYADEGRQQRAFQQIDELLTEQPQSAELIYARALVSTHLGADYEALLTLEQIPGSSRTDEHKQLQHRLWRRYQLTRVEQMMQRNDQSGALALANSIRKQAGNKPAALMVHASALATAKNYEDAFDAAREALALSPAPSVDLQIQYATVLLQAKKHKTLDRVLDRLQEEQESFTADQHDAWERLSMGRAIQHAHTQRQEGELAKAYDTLRPWLTTHSEDPDVMLTMAALYSDSGDPERAREIYQRVISEKPDYVAGWEGAAGAAVSEGDYAAARTYVQEGLKRQPGSTELLALQGVIENLSGNRSAAQDSFRLALETQESRKALGQSADYPLDVVNGITLRLVEEQATATTAFPFKPWEDEQKATVASPDWVPEVKKELARLEDRVNKSVYGGFSARNRDGQSGLDDLTTTRMPVGYNHRYRPDSAWGVQGELVNADAGGFRVNGLDNLSIGTTALDTGFLTTPPADQDNSGFGLSLWWQKGDWNFDLGTTPLGFEEENIIGGVRWNHNIRGTGIKAGLERRSVEDSLLSWSGLKDPRTGQVWGGVVDTSMSIGIQKDKGKFGYYGQLDLSMFDGEHVEDNSAFKATAGVYWKPSKSLDSEFTVGSRLQLMGYDENQRYFTLGHGGYFSPQEYISLTFPVDYTLRSGALRYTLAADLGLYSFSEDSAPLYPRDGGLQAQIEAATGLPASFDSYYQSKDDSGFAYNLKANLQYNLSPQLSLNAELNSSNARDYRDTQALGYLRYYFKPRTTLEPSLYRNPDNQYNILGDEK